MEPSAVMDDIRYKINVVAAIAAVGAAIAFIGTVISWNEFPKSVGFLDMVIYGMITLIGVLNIKPAAQKKNAIWNSFMGILGIIVASVNYFRIADAVPEASAFMDVGIGIWLTFAGIIIFTIFSISDWMYKKDQ
jgi:hypothetical protein